MSATLAAEHCEACRKDSPRVEADDATRLLQQIPDWSIVEQEGVDRLQRIFKFENFVAALGFANAVGEIAEAEQHHPLLVIEWGRVVVQWWTHSISGLHRNDFVMAARTDALFT